MELAREIAVEWLMKTLKLPRHVAEEQLIDATFEAGELIVTYRMTIPAVSQHVELKGFGHA